MAAVEDRNRKQIDQSKTDRQERHKRQYWGNPTASHFAGHLGDPQRTSKLVGGARPFYHLPHRLERRSRQVPCLSDGLVKGGHRIPLDVFHPAPGDAEQANFIVIAEPIGDLGSAGSGF